MKHPKHWYKRIVRRLRGPYSQAELGLACAISQQAVYEYEAGQAIPRQATMRKMVDHYIRWTTKYQIQGGDLLSEVMDALTGLPDEAEGGQP